MSSSDHKRGTHIHRRVAVDAAAEAERGHAAMLGLPDHLAHLAPLAHVPGGFAALAADVRAAREEPPRPGGVVDQLTRRLFDLAGYVRCEPCDLFGTPGGLCPNGHQLAGLPPHAKGVAR